MTNPSENALAKAIIFIHIWRVLYLLQSQGIELSVKWSKYFLHIMSLQSGDDLLSICEEAMSQAQLKIAENKATTHRVNCTEPSQIREAACQHEGTCYITPSNHLGCE